MPGLKSLLINPIHLAQLEHDNPEVIPIIKNFLNRTENTPVWHAQYNYQLEFEQVTYELVFSQSILRREGKYGVRFEVFNPFEANIGKGGYGIVYPINGTIKFNDDELVLKTGNRRLVKIQTIRTESPAYIARDIDNITNEYIKLQQAGHLHPKKPVFLGTTSYLIMKRVKGISLELLLHPTKAKSVHSLYLNLTMSKRLELFMQILLATKAQIKDRNLVHRDIKPGNMMIDLSTDPPSVNNIDYGFAKEQGVQDHRQLGTRAYRAPESFHTPAEYTFASDVYAVGRVLSYLMGDHPSNYYISKNASWDYIKTKSDNARLFSTPEVALFLHDQDRYIIQNILGDMLQENPLKRPTIEQVIERMSLIDISKYRAEERKVYKIAGFHYLLNEQIHRTNKQLSILEEKYDELLERNCLQASETMLHLINKLTVYTNYLMDNPRPHVLSRYKICCVREINLAKEELKQHRDNNWIVAEISAAFSLIGIGYLIALGVNYYNTGRFGLFSQTNSDRLTDDVKNTIIGNQLDKQHQSFQP